MNLETNKSHNRLLIAAVVTIAALVATDVGCTKPLAPATAPDAGKLALCVEQELEVGKYSVIDIAATCDNAAVSVVEDIVASLLKAQHTRRFAVTPKAPHDGGALDSH
jgi:hypothetical protein